MIETRLLKQFIAVAEELHFHKAAKRLHMAQQLAHRHLDGVAEVHRARDAPVDHR